MRCSRIGCTDTAEYGMVVELAAGSIGMEFDLFFCAGHAEELPWLVRLREPREWSPSLLQQIPQEVSP